MAPGRLKKLQPQRGGPNAELQDVTAQCRSSGQPACRLPGVPGEASLAITSSAVPGLPDASSAVHLSPRGRAAMIAQVVDFSQREFCGGCHGAPGAALT